MYCFVLKASSFSVAAYSIRCPFPEQSFDLIHIIMFFFSTPLRFAYTGIKTAQIIVSLLNMPLYVIFATYLAWTTLQVSGIRWGQLPCSLPYAPAILPSVCLPLASHGVPDFRDAMQVEFDGLDNLLSGGVEAMSLSHHMMQTRFSLDDLITVVEASTLGSRDALSEELLKTNIEAKNIAAGLQQFVHAVQSTVDL
jgi:hypothetical protein